MKTYLENLQKVTIVNSTPKGLPDPPEKIEVDCGNRFVNITWKLPTKDGGSEIVGYIIYKGEESNQLFRLDAVRADRYFYNDTTVINGMTYFYRIISVTYIGESIPTDTIICTPMTVPDSPTDVNIHFNIKEMRINITWKPTKNNGGSPVLEYWIYRKVDMKNEIFKVLNSTFYIDYYIKKGIEYTYQVSAWNSVGESTKSDQVKNKPQTETSPIKIVNVASGNGYVNLSWTTPDDNGGVGSFSFVIFRKSINNEFDELIELTNKNLFFFNDTNVINGQEYSYYLKTKNIIGYSEKSNEITTTPLGPLPDVSILKIEIGSTFVHFYWKINPNFSGREITGYEITRNNTTIGTFDPIISHYNDTGLIKDSNYIYEIIVISEKLMRSASILYVKTGGKTNISLPDPPKILSVKVIDEAIMITWIPPDNNTGILFFKIYRQKENSEFSMISIIDYDSSVFMDMNVSKGNSYTYYISCSNEAGESNPSNYVSGEVPNKEDTNQIIIIFSILLILLFSFSLVLLFLYIRRKSNSSMQENSSKYIPYSED